MTCSSKLLVRSALLTLALGALGCGSDGGGKVSSSRKLSALSSSEAKSLCEEFSRANAENIEHECALSALFGFFSEGNASCEEARGECVATFSIDCESEDVQGDLADCDATVGEMRKCQRDQAALVGAIYEGLTCESDPESYETALAELEEPESCDLLYKKCPSEFEEEEVTVEGLRRLAARLRR